MYDAKLSPLCRGPEMKKKSCSKCRFLTPKGKNNTPDKVIPMCRYASQATQKLLFMFLQ